MSKATKAKPVVKEEQALVTMQMDGIEKALETARNFPKRALEIQKEVAVIVSNATKLIEENKGEPLTKDNIESFKLVDRELRTKRTTLDGQRKSDNAPHSNTVAVYNSVYKTFETSIVEAEDKLEPLLKAYTKAEDERKANEKLEKEKKRMERINLIISLGGVFDDVKQVYVIHNPDPNGVNIELNAVDLIGLSDETFESLKLRAVEFKEAKDKAKAEADRLAAQAEADRLAADKKLKEDQEQMLNDRMEVRTQKLELMGFVEQSGYFVNGNIKYKVEDIKVMEVDNFKELEVSVKETIAKAKEQEVFDKRISEIIQLGFKDEGTYYGYRVSGFKYDIDKKHIAIKEDFDSQVANFKLEKEASDKEKEAIDKRISSIVQLGFVSSGNEYVFVREGFEFKINKDVVLNNEDTASSIQEFKTAKDEYDKKQSLSNERRTSLLNAGFKHHSGTIYFKEIGTNSKRIDIVSEDYETELGLIEIERKEYIQAQQELADKVKLRSDKLSEIGLVYEYRTELFLYRSKVSDNIVIRKTKDEIMGYEDSLFETQLADFSQTIEQDKIDKVKYDAEQAQAKALEEANKQTDAQNIEAFGIKVKELFDTVVIKDADRKLQIGLKTASFIKEIGKV